MKYIPPYRAMKCKGLLIVLVLVFYTNSFLLAQEAKPKNRTFGGLGVGIPYGGFGLQLGQQLSSELDVFGGLGYNLVGVGYNVGLKLNIPSEKRTQFYLAVMYGYNSVIKIKNLEESNKSYYGPSFGLGLKLKSRRYNIPFWDFSVILPVRNASFKEDQDYYANNSGITGFTKAFPVLISVGYHFQISAEK